MKWKLLLPIMWKNMFWLICDDTNFAGKQCLLIDIFGPLLYLSVDVSRSPIYIFLCTVLVRFTKTGPNFLSFWWFQNLAVHTNTYILECNEYNVPELVFTFVRSTYQKKLFEFERTQGGYNTNKHEKSTKINRKENTTRKNKLKIKKTVKKKMERDDKNNIPINFVCRRSGNFKDKSFYWNVFGIQNNDSNTLDFILWDEIWEDKLVPGGCFTRILSWTYV